MKTITSRQNPWFKRIREAIREHGQEIVIEGPKQVADAIASGWSPIAVIERAGRPEELSTTSRGPRAPQCLLFTPEIFDAIAETKTSQGVIALFERPRGALAEMAARRDTIVVALDGVQDPGNVGTIVRLAAAFDAAGVALLPGCADAFGPKAIRASAGAILTVPVVEVTTAELVRAGLPLFMAEQGAASTRPPARGAILVFGSEGAGVSAGLRLVATPVAVPMSPRMESLNVATAAAVLLAQSYGARIR